MPGAEPAEGRIRVAYLGHSAAPSGGELALARLLPALEELDAEVILAEPGPLADRLEAAGFSVSVMPLPERTSRLRKERVRVGLPLRAVLDTLRYSWQLRARLRNDDVQIVHTNTLKAAIYGGLAGRLARIPVVWHVRDRIASDYLPRTAVRFVHLSARLLPTAIIVNSTATAATLAGRRATVIPSPLAGQPLPGPANALYAVHDAAEPAPPRAAAPHPFTVGIVGRLAPWKGQDVFLRAFVQAFPDGDERARVVGAAMFGEDDWAASLHELAASLGIASRVDFVGFTDDVPAEYPLMDVAVHASTVPEPFGQVVVEAMAAGVPVVAVNAGGPAEVVTDGVDGLLTPMGDVDALAGAMRRLHDDVALRRTLADAGRRRAADFTAERVAAQVMGVYRAVLAKGRHR